MTDPATQPISTAPPSGPAGPNWGLILLGVLVMLVAGGVLASEVSAFRASQLSGIGPGVLIAVGLVSAMVGIAGMLLRRRH
ncbi:hypothetical protein [Lapillicoccus sp.]|uniref:hypothetical protein n=1 Tax=Lapillicoccus sp. TaxID=1909287 RepID=UPI003982E3D7